MIAILLAAQMISSAPPLSPAEAARILAASPGISNWTNRLPEWPDGPTVTVVDSSPTAGPFGEFAPAPPPRRLDGTLLSDPVGSYSPVYSPWFSFQSPYLPRFHHRSTPQLQQSGIARFESVRAAPRVQAPPSHGATATGHVIQGRGAGRPVRRD